MKFMTYTCVEVLRQQVDGLNISFCKPGKKFCDWIAAVGLGN